MEGMDTFDQALLESGAYLKLRKGNVDLFGLVNESRLLHLVHIAKLGLHYLLDVVEAQQDEIVQLLVFLVHDQIAHKVV